MKCAMRSLEGEELYCAAKFVKVEREGSPEHFVDVVNTVVTVNNPLEEVEEERLSEDVVPFLGGIKSINSMPGF